MRKILLLFAMLLGFSFYAISQTKSVNGKVVDANGTPVPYATIRVNETNRSVAADQNGNFNIEVLPNASITVTATGFEDKKLLVGNSTSLLITLQILSNMQEVVVTALGITRNKNTLAYSAQQVNGEDVSKVRTGNAASSLSGKVSGLQVIQGNSIGGSTNIVIRGIKSLTGNNQALFVVDGTPVDNRTVTSGSQSTGRGGYDYGNSAADINPDDIDNISVLKGAAATALYGSRAANGVIMITTKKGKRGLGISINSGVKIGKIDKSTFAKYQDQYGAGYSSDYDKASFITPPTQKIVAQGGIGTAEEHEFIISYYQLDGAGWGSPFLLVPEATNVDDPTLKLLANAKKEDYYLSNASPLGVPFNNIRNTSSDIQRQERIAKGRPGSPCYKKYLMSNTEFTEKVICTSSRLYQDLKIKQLKSQNLPEEELNRQMADLEAKDCLCEGLTVSARIKNKLHLPHKLTAVTICPGPNLAYFSGVYSLKEMVNHIYGRINLNNALERPHMFVNELQLYIDYLKKQISESSLMVSDKQRKYFEKFKGNLQTGIEYYKSLLPSFSNFKLNTAQLSKLELQLSTILNLVPQPIHI